MLRHPLAKKDKKKIIPEVAGQYPFLNLDVEAPIELGRDSDGEYLILRGEIVLFRSNKTGGRWIPLLKYLARHSIKPQPGIYIDKGASKALLRGADLMAPGVRRVEGGFGKGGVVYLYDEETGALIAVGVALYSSEELKSLSKGKVVEIVHYVGDSYFNKSV
ncbi:DUF1947 domain-containing protein [Thermogladius sp. 4427co]|uniref:DUF1947 domain-containing protein n=1 Tax=Thermogladius sp. 4427co TaxID=3450718 RepID=UPI003F7A1663